MTQEQILEGNKLIAEFMGYKYVVVGYFGETDQSDWQLHNAGWIWLMQVVEKIEKLEEGCFHVFMADTDCNIYFSSKYDKNGNEWNAPSFRQSTGSKITSTWQAVVQFIQWYNKEQNAQVSDTTMSNNNSKAD